MKYRIRTLDIKTREKGLKEFKKIGATPQGQQIMTGKILPLALKIRGVDSKAANILKQEMLSRGGDVVTSRDSLLGAEAKTDVIILGTKKIIKNLAGKIKMQPFGLKVLSVELNAFIERLENIKKRSFLKISNRKFNLVNEVPIMGILNVTPDSFYDGGFYFKKDKAFRRIEEIVSEGAHIVDIGGISTRPGSEPVTLDEEIGRTIPIVKNVVKNYDILVSIDTYRSEVAERAIDAGAHIVNDISAMTFDREMVNVVSKSKVSVIIMHMKGTPKDMQLNPEYKDVIEEIYDFLGDRINLAIESGIKEDKIIIDPGIGFGKKLEHNLEILHNLSEFGILGYPVLVGASRKSFIGKILDLPVEERLEGSIAAAVCSVVNGASILRVHDVKETIRAVKIVKSIRNIRNV
jgi:dihydropteroate synthase